MKNILYSESYKEFVKQKDIMQELKYLKFEDSIADFIILPLNMDGEFYTSTAINSKKLFGGDLIEKLLEVSVEFSPTAVIIIRVVDETKSIQSHLELPYDLQSVLSAAGIILYDFQLFNGVNFYSFLKRRVVK